MFSGRRIFNYNNINNSNKFKRIYLFMWTQLTINDLRKILSEDEIEKLNTLSIGDGITDMINSQIDLISDTWRGALQGKGYSMDIRDHYTPSEYQYWILVHARWAIWTRFPNSINIALDDARKNEYDKCLELLKDPYLNVSDPDWEYSSENPSNWNESELDTEPNVINNQKASIYVPWLRFPTIELYGGKYYN